VKILQAAPTVYPHTPTNKIKIY